MDWQSLAFLADELAVPEGKLGAQSKEKREESIAEALRFKTGVSQDKRYQTELYGPFGDLVVSVGKPGKEADPSRKRPNVNDMTPSLLRDGEDQGYRPTFGAVFSALQEYALSLDGHGEASLHVLGALLFRNAFMLDHAEVAKGVWRYRPSALALDYLEGLHPTIGEIPIRPFVHLIEALALNEDVKYNPPGTAISAAGRPNTLMTCVHATSVFLNVASFGGFVDGMTRGRGVAPLSQREAVGTFRLLRWRGAAQVQEFEDGVLSRLRPHLNLEVNEMAVSAGIERLNPKNKSRVRQAFEAWLRVQLDEDQLDRLKESYNLKVIRVGDDGVPAEDISFSSFREQELALQSWHTSSLRESWSRPFLFVAFSISKTCRERFLGAAFCSIPEDELDGRVRETWHATLAAIVGGQRHAAPKKSQSPFFVRNHAAERSVSPDGEVTTPLAFWLSRNYVMALLEDEKVSGVGRYEHSS